MKLLNTVLIGITSGSIYALMAISIVLVWRSTRIINFAQAGMALASTFIGFEMIQIFHSFWVALPLAMVAGAILAAVIEVIFMRTLTKHSKSGPIAAVAPIIATLGLLGLIKGVLGIFYQNSDALILPPISDKGFIINGESVAISPLRILILATVVILVLLLTYLFEKTNLGLMIRASSFAPEISSLSGVRVGLVRTIGWALSGAAGAAAGMLQTPNASGSISPDSLEFSLLLVYGFVAAVIGGIDSLVGAVVGGLVLGLGMAIVLMYIGASLVFMTAFIILMLVLFVKPSGLIRMGAGRSV